MSLKSPKNWHVVNLGTGWISKAMNEVQAKSEAVRLQRMHPNARFAAREVRP